MLLRIAESKTATLKLLALLSTLSTSTTGVDTVGIVNEAIEVYSAANESAVEDVSRDVLPSILTSAEQYHTFLAQQSANATSNASGFQVVIALLLFGKTRTFVREQGTSASADSSAAY